MAEYYIVKVLYWQRVIMAECDNGSVIMAVMAVL
jgi:hypothetical protein